MLLFLNKDDLFKKKLLTTPIKVEGERFDDFEGPYANADMDPESDEFKECYEAAKEYFGQLFLARNKNKKEVYIHVTCATDSTTTSTVFNATKDIILRNNLQGSGFLTD